MPFVLDAVIAAIVDIDIANAAGGFRPQGDTGAQTQVAIIDLDIFTDAVDTQTIRVPTGFHADAVVITGDMTTADHSAVTGVDVDPVGTGTGVLSHRDMLHQKIFTVTQMDIPEGGAARD